MLSMYSGGNEHKKQREDVGASADPLEIFHFIDKPGHPQLVPIFDYVVGLNERYGRPSRQHFNPAELTSSLTRLILLDVVDGGNNFRCRLCGTTAAAVLGQDITGKDVRELDTSIGQLWMPLLRKSLAEKTLFCYRKNLTEFNKSYFYYEGMLFPFFDDSEGVNMILLAGAAVRPSGSDLSGDVIYDTQF